MARLFSSGFELNVSGNTEWDGSTGSITISPLNARSGTYQLRTSSLSSGNAKLMRRVFASAAATGPFYFRVYIYVTTRPSAENRIVVLNSSTNEVVNVRAYITLDNSGVLRLYDEDGQITGTTTLSLTQWYRLEVLFDASASAGSHVVEAKVDGSTFATASNRSISAGINWLHVGGNGNDEAQTTGSWDMDDVAINDNSGSFQNSYAGSGKIISLRPNAAGDNTAWTNTYQEVGEETPDDATSLIASNTLNQISDFNLNDVDTMVNQPAGTTGSGFGEFAATRYRGMTFRATTTTINAIAMKLDSVGTKGLKIFLYAADSSDLPTGSELASWTIANGSLSTSYTKYSLTPYTSLTVGNLYAIYYAPWDVGGTDTYVDDYRDIQWKNANVYGAGKPIVNTAGTWAVSDSGNLDQHFEIFGSNVIGDSDTINAITVSVRYRTDSGTTTDPEFVVRIKATSGGTVEESASIVASSTSWNTNTGTTLKSPPLILYDLPGASTTAWTKADLDTAQIGVRENLTDTDNVQVSALWMQVDYTPNAGGGATPSPARAYMTTNTSFWGL